MKAQLRKKQTNQNTNSALTLRCYFNQLKQTGQSNQPELSRYLLLCKFF